MHVVFGLLAETFCCNTPEPFSSELNPVIGSCLVLPAVRMSGTVTVPGSCFKQLGKLPLNGNDAIIRKRCLWMDLEAWGCDLQQCHSVVVPSHEAPSSMLIM